MHTIETDAANIVRLFVNMHDWSLKNGDKIKPDVTVVDRKAHFQMQ